MPVSRSIIFFADGSEETHSVLRKVLLARASGTLLDRFLEQAQRALQQESQQVPSVDRKGLPDFGNLLNLLSDDFDESSRHPALHPTEIVLVQLGQFIAAYESQPSEPYPTAEENIIVGVCFGELSASAISLAHSLVELIPIAVETVRIAFRSGILSSLRGDGLETRRKPALSWSTVLSRDSGLDDEAVLQRLADDAGVRKQCHPYLTACSRKTVTIGGSPSALNSLLSHPKVLPFSKARRDIRIYAPYHAPCYFSREDARELVQQSLRFLSGTGRDSWLAKRRTFIGCAEGTYYDAANPGELLERVVYNILAQPIRWEKVIGGCRLALDAAEPFAWHVRPFGQVMLSKSLLASLKSGGHIDIVLDDQFGRQGCENAHATRFPIAIVGMAGRFPEADTPDALWRLLKAGKDCHKEIPLSRFDHRTHLANPAYGCFLDKPGLFDSQFFNISPREAIQTDPGQRLALVTAYEALESSGFVSNRTPSTCLARVGTFFGQVSDEYKEQNMAQNVDTYFIPGSMRAFGTGRINNFFKFGGPALSCDTACSASSVALHMACNAIWNQDCDTAIVGGINICTGSDNFKGLAAGYFLSPTGGCKTWDQNADGYCRGEAVASVVIKSLDAAQADNDNILAVISSIGTNYSSGAESITRPHAGAQESLYKQVLSDAGITAFDIDYIEMHGTGTQAGDTVEMMSVTNVFAPTTPVRPAENPLHIGAVKANIGHGESASGITALIKILLVLREQSIPPHVGITTTFNPKLPNLEERNVCIASTLTALPSKQGQGLKRRVLLNNFSAAGGNTACILEEAPDRSLEDHETNFRSCHVIALSAKSGTSMMKNVNNLIQYIDKNPSISLLDLSYTTAARRIHHPLRQGFIATSVTDLRRQLSSFNLAEHSLKPKAVLKVIFCFTGQGAFYKSLAGGLFQTCRAFKNDLIRFNDISKAYGFGGFLPVIVDQNPGTETVPQQQAHLAMAAIQIALVRLFGSLGIAPTLNIGHSFGEYAALYASGVLSEHDALYLVGQRAAIIEKSCSRGTDSMLVVHAGKSQLPFILGENSGLLELACINSPHQSVLSGPLKEIKLVEAHLSRQGIACRRLEIPFGFHSSQMDPVLNQFEELASTVKCQPLNIPFASPLLGSVLQPKDRIEPSYLRRQLREVNNFYGALKDCEKQKLIDDTCIWLEIGPHPVCLDMIKATFGSQVRALPTLRRGDDPWTSITKCIALLYTLGANIDWQELHRNFQGQRLLDLPTYAWNEKDYWIPYKEAMPERRDRPEEEPVLSFDRSLHDPNTTTVQRLTSCDVTNRKVSLTFATDLAEPKMHALIAGHVINGSGLVPASVYADIALTVAEYIRSNFSVQVPFSGIDVGPMEILRPIILARQRPLEKVALKISVAADLSNGEIAISYTPVSQGPSINRETARCKAHFKELEDWLCDWAESAYLMESRMDCLSKNLVTGSTNRFLRDMAYKLFRSSFVDYDQKFQGMEEILLNTSDLEAMAKLSLYPGRDTGTFTCSPLWIDSFVHLAGFVMNVNDRFDHRITNFISDGWTSFRLAEEINPAIPYKVYVKMHDKGDAVFSGNASIFRDGKLIGRVEGLKFKGIPHSTLNAIIPPLSQPPENAPMPFNYLPIVSHREVDNGALLAQRSSQKRQGQAEKTTSQSKPPPSFDDVLLVIAEEIGSPTDTISLDSTFHELGIDSLLSLTIVPKLNRLFSLTLPPTLFQDSLSIRDLQAYFFSALGKGPVSSLASSSVSMPTPVSSIDLNLKSTSDQEASEFGSKGHLLRSLVAEQMQISIDELMLAENISLLGMDSLMSLVIADAIRARLGITVPIDVLTQGKSMAQLEKDLGITSAASTDPQSPEQQPTRIQVPLSTLLQGSSAWEAPILFLFPDGSGSATSYLALPTISPRFRVYGLNSPFLRRGRDASFNMDDLILPWLSEIQTLQPSGPYYLGGWSAGGYYAFETAKKLMDAGKEVRKLILIDTPPMNVYEPMPSELLDWLDSNRIMGGDESRPTPSWLVDHFEITLKALSGYHPTPMQGSRVPQVYIIWAADSVLDSVPHGRRPDPPLNVKVSQFLIRQRANYGPHGWEKLIPGCDLLIAKTSGSHFTMVLPSHNQHLSSLLASAIEATEMADGYQSFKL